jgi:hypothetical protein
MHSASDSAQLSYYATYIIHVQCTYMYMYSVYVVADLFDLSVSKVHCISMAICAWVVSRLWG